MAVIHFAQRDWERIERDTMAWWAGELERPLVYLTASDPLPQAIPYRFLSNYPLDMSADEVLDLCESVLTATHFYCDAFPSLWVNFGPGIMAGFMGATVHSVSEPQETVWFSPAREVEIQHLDLDYDPENVWWERVRDLTSAIARR